jgi:uncharacterized protein YnzC (UPF0291/DUF896 family)
MSKKKKAKVLTEEEQKEKRRLKKHYKEMLKADKAWYQELGMRELESG